MKGPNQSHLVNWKRSQAASWRRWHSGKQRASLHLLGFHSLILYPCASSCDFTLSSARAPTFPGFPGSGIFNDLGSLYARHWTLLSLRDPKEGRLRTAVRSGEKAGASKERSIPVSQDPSLRNILLRRVRRQEGEREGASEDTT